MRARFVLAVMALSFALAPAGAAEHAKRPNFIFILSDDQGWSEMSAPMDPSVPQAASKYLETPNLARMAKAGMRFQSGYSPAPLCTPTRRSIQCGMTPARQHGTEFKSTFDWSGQLTLPKALKSVDSAYRCAHFGKYGENIDVSPEEIGYDESDGFTGNKTGGCPQDMKERGATLITDDPKLTDTMTGRPVPIILITLPLVSPALGCLSATKMSGTLRYSLNVRVSTNPVTMTLSSRPSSSIQRTASQPGSSLPTRRSFTLYPCSRTDARTLRSESIRLLEVMYPRKPTRNSSGRNPSISLTSSRDRIWFGAGGA